MAQPFKALWISHLRLCVSAIQGRPARAAKWRWRASLGSYIASLGSYVRFQSIASDVSAAGVLPQIRNHRKLDSHTHVHGAQREQLWKSGSAGKSLESLMLKGRAEARPMRATGNVRK